VNAGSKRDMGRMKRDLPWDERIGSLRAATKGPSEPASSTRSSPRANCTASIPFDYVRDVLVRVGDHPAQDILALSPKNWKKPAEYLDTPQTVASAG
jgi:hypothetical protein